MPQRPGPTAPARRNGRIAVAAASLLLLVALQACSSDDGGDDAGLERGAVPTASSSTAEGEGDPTDGPDAGRRDVEVFEPGDPAFYTAPAPIPDGEHGDLLRTQAVDGAPEGVTWQRIMYLSESVTGEPTVVTGVMTLPTAPAPADGWPLFSHAHGSTGLADACAPSVSLGADRGYAIEIALMSAHVAEKGIAVVSSDYEGLGGPGRHPFLVGESEGRGVLDALRAARQLPDVRFTDQVGIVGYSQGGHAAAWADQIAPEWTPELDISGVLAGAPATEVDDMVEGDDGSQFLMVAALATTDADLDPSTVLTDAGIAALDEVDTVCQDGYQATGPLVSVDIATTEPWSSAIAANVPGDEPGAAPVLIVHSQEDASVPVEGSEAYQERLCAAGQVVERRVLPEGDHVTAAVESYEQGIDWILRLQAGDEPRSTCA